MRTHNLKILKIIIPLALMFAVLLPLNIAISDEVSSQTAQATQVVPNCGYFDTNGDFVECGFTHFIQLANNFIDILINIAIPLSVIMFALAGFLYITSRGDKGKLEKAHSIFKNVIIGLIVLLGAWLVVKGITSALLQDSYTLLDEL